MVLWEITLGTAYFLGLRRTYRLALKIQRKLINPKYPKIKDFVRRRTRNVFDVALNVHLKIQERDIEVGRNLGNWILRWLDKIKPAAQIKRPPLPPTSNTNTKMTKQPMKDSSHLNNQGGNAGRNGESDRHLFTVARNVWPPITMMMRPTRAAGNSIQYRQYGSGGSEHFTVKNAKFGFGELQRNDIKHWILHY